jgi:hypothetical protein
MEVSELRGQCIVFQCFVPLSEVTSDEELKWEEVGGGDWADVAIFKIESGRDFCNMWEYYLLA